MTISGTNLTGATAVKSGPQPRTGITVVSATQIKATARLARPARSMSKVTTGNGTSAASASDQYTYATAPEAGAVGATVSYGSAGNAIALNIERRDGHFGRGRCSAGPWHRDGERDLDQL